MLLAALLLALAVDDPVAPSDPVFDALLADGTTVAGRLKAIGGVAGPEVVLAVGDPAVDRAVPIAKLVKLTRRGVAPPALPEGSVVLLPEGDRLAGLVHSATEEVLSVTSPLLGDQAVPLTAAVGVVLSPPAEPDALASLFDRVRGQPRDGDLAWLANGDRLAGRFQGLDAEALKFAPEAGPITLDRSSLLAVGFDPALTDYPRPEGPFLELTLTDGTRLGVRDPVLAEGNLMAAGRHGAPVRLVVDDLAGLAVRGGAATYLSERPEPAAQYVPYVGPVRPLRLDASVVGGPLLLGGRAYDRGLGTESRTLLAYRLEPDDSRFQATVGVDDRAGPLASVVFKVVVDREVAFESPPMSAGDPPLTIDLPVAGARLLILMTEFGRRGSVRDFADWAEARVVRD